jgi:hypothetical protein
VGGIEVSGDQSALPQNVTHPRLDVLSDRLQIVIVDMLRKRFRRDCWERRAALLFHIATERDHEERTWLGIVETHTRSQSLPSD